MKVLTIFGTRPEAIKMAPVVKQLKKFKDIESKVCITAQHRDMLDQALNLFDIAPDFDLNIMEKGQTLYSITTKVLLGLEGIFKSFKPDWILVHGDTTTSFAAALAGFYAGIKVGHVEAGLRTYNLKAPFPEEANRQLTARLADINFAPTMASKLNLLNENIPERNIILTGNTIVDALNETLEKIRVGNLERDTLQRIIPTLTETGKLVLVTAHRRENFGLPLEHILDAIGDCAQKRKDVHFLYPVHPNPNVRQIAIAKLSGIPNVTLTSPLDYQDLLCVMNRSSLILSDSGGIQEEAPSLGKRVLVLRESTERIEALENGNIELVGSNKELIISRILHHLDTQTIIGNNPFGDGNAASRIVEYILIGHQ